jgi:hypothetical protein
MKKIQADILPSDVLFLLERKARTTREKNCQERSQKTAKKKWETVKKEARSTRSCFWAKQR